VAERDLRGTWKAKPKRVAKSPPIIIGMIYEGVDKFFGNKVVGMLVEMFDQNDEAVLKTKQNKLTSVDKKSLKIVASD
jgi:hypothetical protein